MIVVTVFLPILNQIEFHLVQNRKENCHHYHIPFNVKGNGNIVFSVYVGYICGYRILPNQPLWLIGPTLVVDWDSGGRTAIADPKQANLLCQKNIWPGLGEERNPEKCFAN